MQAQTNNPQDLIQQIQEKPYLLNQITQAYLEHMCVNSPGFTNWQIVQASMRQLNDDSTSIQKCLLLFNALRVVVSDTFSSIQGLKENKIYGWISMVYAVKCDKLVEELEVLREGLNNKSKELMQWLQTACYGLVLSQMVIGLAQKSMKLDSSNRVFYPQFYRLISIILNRIQNFKLPNISEQSSNTQNIMTTNILQQLNESKSSSLKKQKQNKQKGPPQNNIPHISTMIVTKITQLLVRSFTMCRKKTVQKLNIVTQTINSSLNNLKNGIINNNQGNNSLLECINGYLGHFEEINVENGEAQEIDEQNKIIKVKELTPRFVDEDDGFEIKKLRTKKKKLIKKIQSDAKAAKMNKLQQQKVLNDVRNERVMKRHKKQMFVLQKQTEEAKKQHNKLKRVKQITKQGKGKNGNQNKQGKHKRN